MKTPTLHSNSPAAIIAFLIQFCDDFSMHHSFGLYTPHGRDSYSFIFPDTHTIGIEKLPEIYGWTDGWIDEDLPWRAL